MKTKLILNNGTQIPVLGLGTWKANGRKLGEAIKYAVDSGYRLIDTASYYGNEKVIGDAIEKYKIPRESLFITSKVWKTDQGYHKTLKAIDKSLELLQIDYLDLYLIHWPHPKIRKDTWKAMEKILDLGKAKAIGVSNYTIKHLKELLTQSKVVPAVNQIEFHPFQYESSLLDYCKSKNIIIEAYSPLVRAKKMNNPLLLKISKKYQKTPAQILLRWGMQHGVVPLPKSTNQNRIIENTRVFDFEIIESDMELLNNSGEEFRVIDWNPKDMEWQ